jgi:two-component system, OmpR family, alkaline phosphatase synthesis response regulator PhoP
MGSKADARLTRAKIRENRPVSARTVLISFFGLSSEGLSRRPAGTGCLYSLRMSKILVVEDDPDIANLIRHYLEKNGHTVQSLATGAGVLSRLRADPADLVILDVMLPEVDGLVICQAMRNDPAMATIPVIMLTARGDEADRVAGFELGTDDYVTKPFSPKELSARVTALLRRTSRLPSGAVLHYGAIAIDADRHAVTVDGEEVRLTAKEFLLLQYLVQHRGRVLSRDLLLTDVWGYQYTGGTRTVDVHIRRLREKLPLLGDAIQTIKQFGYKLAERPDDLS